MTQATILLTIEQTLGGGQGWSAIDDGMYWPEGAEASLVFRAGPERTGFDLSVSVEPQLSEAVSHRDILVRCNGLTVGRYVVSAPTVLDIAIPDVLIQANEPVAVEFVCRNSLAPNPLSPGHSQSRETALSITRTIVCERREVEARIVLLDTEAPGGGSLHALVGEGWHEPEPDRIWAKGRESTFYLDPVATCADAVLCATLEPYIGHFTPHQRLFVEVNGFCVGYADLRGRVTLGFRVPAEVLFADRSNVVAFVCPDARVPRHIDEWSMDRRNISVAVFKLSIRLDGPAQAAGSLQPSSVLPAGAAPGRSLPPGRLFVVCADAMARPEFNAWSMLRWGATRGGSVCSIDLATVSLALLPVYVALALKGFGAMPDDAILIELTGTEPEGNWRAENEASGTLRALLGLCQPLGLKASVIYIKPPLVGVEDFATKKVKLNRVVRECGLSDSYFDEISQARFYDDLDKATEPQRAEDMFTRAITTAVTKAVFGRPTLRSKATPPALLSMPEGPGLDYAVLNTRYGFPTRALRIPVGSRVKLSAAQDRMVERVLLVQGRSSARVGIASQSGVSETLIEGQETLVEILAYELVAPAEGEITISVDGEPGQFALLVGMVAAAARDR